MQKSKQGAQNASLIKDQLTKDNGVIGYGSSDQEDYQQQEIKNSTKKTNLGQTVVGSDYLSREHKKYEEDVNKILGPVENKIKKSMNNKLKKKYKQNKKYEEKKLLTRIGENEENLYDFIQDFSSSDYETVSEDDIHVEQNFLYPHSIKNRQSGIQSTDMRNRSIISNTQAKDGFVNHFDEDESKNPDYDQNQLIGKLLDSYKKFEKRKVPKKPVYFRNPRVPIIVQKEQLTLQYRDVMVFETLDLKKKFKQIFKKGGRGGIGGTSENEDNSHSDTETRKSAYLPKSDNEEKKQRINEKIQMHLKNGSLSGLSNSAKSGSELQKIIDDQRKMDKKVSVQESQEKKKSIGGFAGLEKHPSVVPGVQADQLYNDRIKKNKQQQKLDQLKDEIKKNIDFIERIEENNKQQQEINQKIIVKDIETVQQKLRQKDPENITRLKDSINTKVREIQDNKQEYGPTLDMIQKREKWLIQLKTHIGKFQSEVLAFSVKKYFNKWKKINEEFKVRQMEIEKQQQQQQISIKDDLKPSKKDKNNKKGDTSRNDNNNKNQSDSDDGGMGYNQQRQFDVFLPSDKIKKKLIPHCYNIYRPKKDE
eukprot:403363593